MLTRAKQKHCQQMHQMAESTHQEVTFQTVALFFFFLMIVMGKHFSENWKRPDSQPFPALSCEQLPVLSSHFTHHHVQRQEHSLTQRVHYQRAEADRAPWKLKHSSSIHQQKSRDLVSFKKFPMYFPPWLTSQW